MRLFEHIVQIMLNITEEFSPHRKGNPILHNYRDKLFNAVYEYNHCLQRDLYRKYKGNAELLVVKERDIQPPVSFK
jgi:hypothetical protein